MEREKIIVANLNGSSSAEIITAELQKNKEIIKSFIDIDSNTITVIYQDISRDEIVGILASIGHPEATESNGLLRRLNNYNCCMNWGLYNL